MDNKEILKQLKLTAALLELHQDPAKNDENFKIRGYTNAIFNIEKLDRNIAGLPQNDLFKIEGIGKSMASVIYEIATTGTSTLLNELLQRTPPGILELLKLKGIGPKKIRVIWDDLKIETPVELLQACEEGRVKKLKGFGEKTEQNIKQALLYVASNKGKIQYVQAEKIALLLQEKMKELFPQALISPAGELRRKAEIIERIVLVVGTDTIYQDYQKLARLELLDQDVAQSGPFTWRGTLSDQSLKLEIHFSDVESFYKNLFLLSGSKAHLAHVVENRKTLIQVAKEKIYENEEAIYMNAQLPYIVPELREGLFEFNPEVQKQLDRLIKIDDLKGVIHCHSTYSDGKNSVREMAEKCIELGYEYLGITDHSKSAFYANGLEEYRVKQQHQEIDLLNQQLFPFKVFKGIESDILTDGSLDYTDEVLAEFDFVVASVHSNLSMELIKATDRLVKAISNPFTTMLGHPTGRLLLRREGYPIDYKEVIDACAHYGVIIEINANPNRLDMDWRWIQYAVEKGVMLSINPDAHEVETISNMYYGVCVARKGALLNNFNFNCFSRQEADDYFIRRKKLMKI